MSRGGDAALFVELERQQQAFGFNEARQRALARLSAGAPVVVTGQQVGLFLGPAYAVYKAATAIVEARAREAVPVFWLQAEDHDADEVSRCHVLDGDGEVRTITLTPPGPARSSLSHQRLGAGVEAALAELSAALEDAPHHDACLAMLREAYRPEHGWVQAFGRLIARLFADEGLIVFQPRTEAVAALARPVHGWAIERAAAIDTKLACDRPTQVAVREGCLLSFLHPEGPEGPRFRPTAAEHGYRWPGATSGVTAGELLARLDSEPMAFSTSALLRPLLQDHLFATDAYVGGPSERSYLEQVKPLYEDFGIPMPAVVSRARFVVTDSPTRRRLAALGIAATDLEQEEEALLARLAPKTEGPSGATVRDEVLGPLLAQLEELRGEISHRGLDPAFDKTARHVERGLGRLAERIDAALRRSDETLSERLAYLSRRLRPDGQPQERRLCFPHFAARFGPRAFVEAALAGVSEDRSLKELSS